MTEPNKTDDDRSPVNQTIETEKELDEVIEKILCRHCLRTATKHKNQCHRTALNS